MNNRDKQENLVRFLRSHVPGVRVTICPETKEYRLLETGGVNRLLHVGLNTFGLAHIMLAEKLAPLENGTNNLVVRAFKITNEEAVSRHIKEWLPKRKQQLLRERMKLDAELGDVEEQMKVFGVEESKAAVTPLFQQNLFAPSSQPLTLCQLLKNFLDVNEVSQNLTTFQFTTLRSNHDEIVQKLQKIDGIDPPNFAIAPKPSVFRRDNLNLPAYIVTIIVTIPEFFIESLFKANDVKPLTPKDFLNHAISQELDTIIPIGVLGITSEYVGWNWQAVFDALSEAPKNQPAAVSPSV